MYNSIITWSGKEQNNSTLINIGEDYLAHCVDITSFENLMSIYGHNNSQFWLAINEQTDEVLGSVALDLSPTNSSESVGELRRMSVSISHRRKGIASSLVMHLLSYARSLGLREVFLSTPTVNLPGIGLYRSVGFEVDRVEVVNLEKFGHLELTFLVYKLLWLCL